MNMTHNGYDTDNASQKHSHPLEAQHFGCMHASFFHEMELCAICCKKLVQKNCARKHDTQSRNLHKLTCTRSVLVEGSWVCATVVIKAHTVSDATCYRASNQPPRNVVDVSLLLLL